MDARRLVITSVVGTGIVAGIGQFAQGKVPTLKMGIGLLFAGTVLAVGADVVPELAGPFAVLMLATTVFVYGGPAFSGVNRAVGGVTGPNGGFTRPTRSPASGAGSGL